MRILGSFQASCIELYRPPASGFEQTRLYQSSEHVQRIFNLQHAFDGRYLRPAREHCKVTEERL